MTARLMALDAQAPPHLGAVIYGLRRVLSLLFEAEVAYGQPRFRPADRPLEHELTLAVAFSGDVDGWLTLGISRATAVALAGSLTADRGDAFSAMAGEGMAEVANVLAGACAMAAHRRGFRLRLGQPVVTVDEPLTVAWPTPVVLEIPIVLPHGHIVTAMSMRVRGAHTPATSLHPDEFWSELLRDS